MLTNNHSTFILSLKNRKGQVALFVALIFQVLFLFFAMVINVGLLVHHKINLQNSVDLAAYYGAAKQAEDLNAIGHMNYQIRQSWKLLAWRYRMLGSAGEYNVHPYQKVPSPHLDTAAAIETVSTSGDDLQNMEDGPAFCITYVPFGPYPFIQPGENTCKDMSHKSGVALFKKPPPPIPGLPLYSLNASVYNIAVTSFDNAIARCKTFGTINYVLLGKFVVAFKADQGDRLAAINELSSKMSTSTDDFYDLNGDSVSQGMEKTLDNNLTAPNRASRSNFKIYNSLGSSSCGQTGDPGRPVKWLNSVKIYPSFLYLDTDCNPHPTGSDPEIQTNGRALTGSELPKHYHETSFVSLVDSLKDQIGYASSLTDNFNFSIGVEKNPWCMAYVGASAETRPVIPFSPFGSITLKARAFFKPFGGRVGPWYKESWSSGSDFSDGAKMTDPLLPTNDVSKVATSDITVLRTSAANYSRYVGDPYGLKSAMMLGYYGKAIYELDPSWKLGGLGAVSSAIATAGSAYVSKGPNLSDWDELPGDFTTTTKDILAWDKSAGAPSMMRKLEMSAVAPNAFDIAYYSIDPDFFHNYYKPMQDGFFSKVGSAAKKSFRPDIGFHEGYQMGSFNLKEFSVKDQIAEITNTTGPGSLSDADLPIQSKFSYTVRKWQNLLTGWNSVSMQDYNLDPKTFGECATPPEPGVPNPGNCVVGGSTGYSVKMISSDYLNQTGLNLGGVGTSGAIKNPPPPDF